MLIYEALDGVLYEFLDETIKGIWTLKKIKNEKKKTFKEYFTRNKTKWKKKYSTYFVFEKKTIKKNPYKKVTKIKISQISTTRQE